ncbi:leucine-rich repeat domain-containing protein [uncultured Ruminococcus sp.]|uniref:leucine-rich repeat domain-containing protein n=1 Tax=uncultured Ruminococcus sp. TaxID=165186 RepID=UPI0025DC9758|nr:leucine-rich repeat domain-containing protein [uncultured Ruminococcus sp.]
MNNTLKKVTAGMLALALVAGDAPANVGGFLTGGTAIAANAATVSSSGNCGTTGHESEVRWTLDSDGVLTITGTGAMADYSSANNNRAPWYSDKYSINSIIIQSGITHIGNYSLNNCTELNNATIPNTVTTIGDHAFYKTKLTTVNIPSSVTRIGNEAFRNTNSLKTVNFEDRTTELSIGSYAFPASLTSLNPKDLVYTTNTMTEPAPLTCDILYSSYEKTIKPKPVTITYNEVPAVSPTCTTSGNSEYYEGSNGKYYSKSGDTYTEIDENSWMIPATGVHTYDDSSPMWTWIRKGDSYDVTVKFKCKDCGDIETPDEQPTLNVVDNGGFRTFTATVTYNDIEYKSTKSEETCINITVNGTEKQYRYGVQVKAVAQVPAGKYFEGWYETGTDNKVSGSETYCFYATRDMSIEARYTDDQVAAEPVLTMNLSNRQALANGKNKVSFTYDWELPKGCTLQSAAIIRSYVIAEPTISTMDTNVHYTALTTARGTYKINLTIGAANADKAVYVRGYIKYKDKNGSHEAYTDVFTSASLN